MYKCKKVTCIPIRGVVTKGGWAGIDRADWLASLAKI